MIAIYICTKSYWLHLYSSHESFLSFEERKCIHICGVIGNFQYPTEIARCGSLHFFLCILSCLACTQCNATFQALDCVSNMVLLAFIFSYLTDLFGHQLRDHSDCVIISSRGVRLCYMYGIHSTERLGH